MGNVGGVGCGFPYLRFYVNTVEFLHMDDVLALAFFLFLVALAVGWVRPQWVRMTSRKRVTWVFGTGALLIAFLGAAFSDVGSTSPVTQTAQTTEQSSTREFEGEGVASSSVTQAEAGEVAPQDSLFRESGSAQPVATGTKVNAVESHGDAVPDERVLSELFAVVDGDTIKVSMNGKVETLRLIGIDTPETKDPRKPVQCFGAEASRKATELLAGQKVRLEADASQGERDKYGRLLRYVWRGDGLFFNDWMIRNGYAFEYTYNKPYTYQSKFKEAQRYASDKNLGLWSPSTCDGEASAVETTKPSVVPAVAEGGGHTFYTSSHSSAKYYYCDTDPGWQSLSTANLRSFSSEADLRNAFSSRTLHEPCK